MASPSGPPAGAGGKKILGLRPRTALIGGGAILAAALAFFWWRSRQASSTATSATASAGAYAGADDTGQLDQLQAELQELLQEQGASGSGTSGGGGTTTGTTPPAAPGTPGAPGAGNKPITTLTPPTAPKATTTAAKPKPAMPAGVRETKVTANSVTLTWAKDPNATTYRVRVTYQGKLVGAPHVVTGTSATISGLGANRTYTFHVAAIGPGGTSSETNGPAVKTKA